VIELATGNLRSLSRAECQFGYRDSLFKQQRGRYAITALTLRLFRNRQPSFDYPDLQVELARQDIKLPTAIDVARAVISIRQAKLPDPSQTANVGSFFKNPVVTSSQLQRLQRSHPILKSFPVDTQESEPELYKLSAAQLIDICGFKARGNDAVGVWPKQPLVIVNHAAVTAEEIIAFASEIQAEVAKRFQIQLEIEPDLIGFS
jgi:UDP-N-acetylmuramate dehydrogenase